MSQRRRRAAAGPFAPWHQTLFGNSFARTIFLRAAVMAVAFLLLAWPYSVVSGLLAAVAGAVLGVVFGEAAAHSVLRTSSGVLLAAVVGFSGATIARGLLVTSAPSRWLGPVSTLWVAEAVGWSMVVFAIVFALRLIGRRSAFMAVLEVAIVASAVTASVAAHRDGMVHRPYAIGDWAWSRGIDPGVVLLVLGGIASFGLALLLFDRRVVRLADGVTHGVTNNVTGGPPGMARGARITSSQTADGRGRWRHVVVLALLAFFLVFLVRTTGGPSPRVAGDLGLTGDPADGEDQQGGGREGDGETRPRKQDGDQLGDLQFKNEYASGGNEAPVAVVVLHDDYAPPSGVYYFRQSAFSQYNGRRLVQTARDDVDQDLVDRFPNRPLRIPDAPPVGPERMALSTSIGLLADHVRPFALDSPAELRPIRNPNPARFRRAFAVESRVQTVPYDMMIGAEPGHIDWDDEQWRYYTEAPSDPRYRELAESLLVGLKPAYRGDPLAEALIVKDYLDRTGIYSRKSSHADTTDPTASFLFGDKTGYCVHFAHAATFLLRSLGLPARVAAGYAVPESSRGSGSSLMIRGMNAHAWPELYLDDIGWVVIDPAPQQSLDEAFTPPDQALQRMLGEMMRESDQDELFEETLADRFDLAAMAVRLLLLAMAAVLMAYCIKVYRQLAPHVTRGAAIQRLGYRAALDQLVEVGLRRELGETREAFARRVAGQAPAFVQLSDRHVAWAFGSRRCAEPGELRHLAHRVRSELGVAVPVWRRLLGALDPFSWLRAR
jgi:transglutaminase-like putative cysteine protease